MLQSTLPETFSKSNKVKLQESVSHGCEKIKTSVLIVL